MAYDPYDLKQHAPRSPRVRLGGYVILPRLLDKCRASLKQQEGDYEYGCSLDKYFLDFVGIDPEALKNEVAKGLGDGALLVWIETHARFKRLPHEIAAFSLWHEGRVPTTPEKRAKLNSHQCSSPAGAARTDIGTWFELLDLDDHASFNGLV